MGFVQFMNPADAAKALSALDGSIYQGRLLHLLPAYSAPAAAAAAAGGQTGLSRGSAFQQQRTAALKATAAAHHNHNPLLMQADSVAGAMATALGVDKGTLVGARGENVATRLAISEAKLQEETRAYFLRHGISFEALNRSEGAAAVNSLPRSNTLILVKHIPAHTSPNELRTLFERFGTLSRVRDYRQHLSLGAY